MGSCKDVKNERSHSNWSGGRRKEGVGIDRFLSQIYALN